GGRCDPSSHGAGAPVRGRRGTGCTAVRAHGDRAALSDPAGPVPPRDRSGGGDPAARNDLVMHLTSDAVLSTFLLFCRIGGCLMLMPGFASPRVPAQIRLFIAIAVTLALAPLLLP